MLDIIKLAIGSPAGSFAFVLSLILLGFWITHWVTKKITVINAEHGSMSKNMIKMETNIDDIRKDLSYLRGTIDIVKAGLNPLTQSHSPVSITELGNQISLELGVEEIISRNWDKIYKNLEDNIHSNNAYDIQEYCMETAAVDTEKFLSDKDLSKLKNYAFKKGNNIQYYTGIFAVIIRDKYLQLKGIDISEIDENDPKKQ